MPNAVLLNKHNLAVAEFASKEESRYTLQAIQVTQDETVATNGHYIVRVDTPKADVNHFPTVAGTVPTVEAESFLLARQGALDMIKVLPKKQTIPILNHAKVGVDAEGNVQAITTDLETHRPVTIRKVTGQYPNWKALWPKKAPTVTVGVSAAYLAQLAKVAATYSEQSCYMEISIWDAQSMIRLDAYDSNTNQHFTALLMPMRGDMKDRPFPWDAPALPAPPIDPFADVPEPMPPTEAELAAIAAVNA